MLYPPLGYLKISEKLDQRGRLALAWVERSQDVGGPYRESAPDLEVGERSEGEDATQKKLKIPERILVFI